VLSCWSELGTWQGGTERYLLKMAFCYKEHQITYITRFCYCRTDGKIKFYTHIHKYIHTYIHTYIYTYVRTYVHTYIHTYTRTYIHTYIHTHIQTYTYIRTYIHTYIHDRLTPSLWRTVRQSAVWQSAVWQSPFTLHLTYILWQGKTTSADFIFAKTYIYIYIYIYIYFI
jgi:hypothetical protein